MPCFQGKHKIRSKLLCQLKAKCFEQIKILHTSKTNCFHICPIRSDFTHVTSLKQEGKNIFIYQLQCFLLNVLRRFLLKVDFCLSRVEYITLSKRPQELVDYCRSREIVFEGYCPLAKGEALTHPSIIQLAKKYGRTLAQICICWSIQVMEGGNKPNPSLRRKKNKNVQWLLFIKPEHMVIFIFFLSFNMLISCDLIVLYRKMQYTKQGTTLNI